MRLLYPTPAGADCDLHCAPCSYSLQAVLILRALSVECTRTVVHMYTVLLGMLYHDIHPAYI